MEQLFCMWGKQMKSEQLSDGEPSQQKTLQNKAVIAFKLWILMFLFQYQ